MMTSLIGTLRRQMMVSSLIFWRSAILTIRSADIEPRTAPSRSVDMFLDLAATEEDHQEVRP